MTDKSFSFVHMVNTANIAKFLRIAETNDDYSSRFKVLISIFVSSSQSLFVFKSNSKDNQEEDTISYLVESNMKIQVF